jgi:hypothetical protein
MTLQPFSDIDFHHRRRRRPRITGGSSSSSIDTRLCSHDTVYVFTL